MKGNERRGRTGQDRKEQDMKENDMTRKRIQDRKRAKQIQDRTGNVRKIFVTSFRCLISDT